MGLRRKELDRVGEYIGSYLGQKNSRVKTLGQRTVFRLRDLGQKTVQEHSTIWW